MQKDINLKRFQNYVQTYQNSFLKLATKKLTLSLTEDISLKEKLKKEIGLSYNDGLHGELRENIHQTDDILKHIVEELKTKLDNQSSKNSFVTIMYTLLIMAFILLVTFLMVKDIVSTLNRFKGTSKNSRYS